MSTLVAASSARGVVEAGNKGDSGGGGGGLSLGKGAWDCDAKQEIPADKEAEVFEEIANMDMPYEGIPTVPMRKDMDHMVCICRLTVITCACRRNLNNFKKN